MLLRLFLFIGLCGWLPGQDQGAAVVINGHEVMRVLAPLGPYTAAERAAEIQRRLEYLGSKSYSREVKAEPLRSGEAVVVRVGPVQLMVVTGLDAEKAGVTKEVLAARYAGEVERALTDYQTAHSFSHYVTAVVKTLLAWAVFAVLLWLLLRAMRWVQARMTSWFQREARARQVRGVSLLIWERGTLMIWWLVRAVLAIVVLFQLSFLISYTLSLYPQTADVSTTLLDYLRATFGGIGKAVVDYLPSGGFVVIACLLTYYVLRVLRLLARAVEHGDLAVPGLHPEMAMPTYQLARILAVIFALVVVFPYLPGGQSEAFKGISILLGVLISLGSGSAVSNVMAGVMLTYMRPFRVGDRVEIAGTTGDVLEKTLLVTRLRTVKNVEVVLPNSAIAGGHILNYSAMSRSRGLVLHTTVTLGYDAPWRVVHELLLTAAQRTEGVLPDPAPFVLQTSLNDYHISYQLNAYTDKPNESEAIYSRLHVNIQDCFNQAGVEIMSPSYQALRDGNTTTIPEQERPSYYRPPSFRVGHTD
jgi:small-conductance mechanosensitive channel